jgi:Uma2 family endonuclease
MLFSSKKNVIAEKRILLKKVTWPKFTEILNELGSDRTVNLTYDRGRLELMTPQNIHDRAQRLLDSLLVVVADEFDETLHGIHKMDKQFNRLQPTI